MKGDASLVRIPADSREGVPGTITYGLRWIPYHSRYTCNTQFWIAASFSGVDRNGRKWASSGVCHDEILATRPDLKPLVDLHECDGNGVPEYAEERGWYWLAGALGGLGEGQGGSNGDPQRTPEECLQTFTKYMRISLNAATILATKINSLILKGDAWTWKRQITSLLSPVRAARLEFHAFIEAQKPRWRQEAVSAINACLRPMPSPVTPKNNTKSDLLFKPETKCKPLPKPRISYTLYFTRSVWPRVLPLLGKFGIDPAALEKPSPSRPGIYTAHLFIRENKLKDLLAIMPNDPTLPDEFKPQPDPPPPYPPDFHGGI